MFTFLTWLKAIIKILLFALLFAICAMFISHLVMSPSNVRNWNDDQDTLSYAKVVPNSDIVTVYNIRNFTYLSPTQYSKNYYDRTIDTKTLKRAWYVVEPFSGIPGSAHTFLSFEFDDNTFLSVSVEIRKEKGEEFHPIKGLYDQYELMYVWADEKDVIKLRSNYRKDEVYVYPIKATEQKVEALFRYMVDRTNKLHDNPEFYNTITNNCTSNIVEAVNSISTIKIPLLNLSVIFPENSDKFAHGLGLIDSEEGVPFAETRKRWHINERAIKYSDEPDWSLKIRGENYPQSF